MRQPVKRRIVRRKSARTYIVTKILLPCIRAARRGERVISVDGVDVALRTYAGAQIARALSEMSQTGASPATLRNRASVFADFSRKLDREVSKREKRARA